jgi:hypothetical protein
MAGQRGRPRRDDWPDNKDLEIWKTIRLMWRERCAAGKPWDLEAVVAAANIQLRNEGATWRLSRRSVYRSLRRINLAWRVVQSTPSDATTRPLGLLSGFLDRSTD